MLYYNARYYDPALARFVSADTIGFDLKQPQTTNRYSYALNNPLKYTDPTGNCSAPNRNNPDIQEENARCRALQRQLGEYRYTIDNLFAWQSWELLLLIDATKALISKADWSLQDFKNAIGSVLLIRQAVVLDSSGRPVYALSGVDSKGRPYTAISDAMFRGNGPKDPEKNARFTFVHELAHHWDRRHNLSGSFSQKVISDTDHVGHATNNPSDDFAQSVATKSRFNI